MRAAAATRTPDRFSWRGVARRIIENAEAVRDAYRPA
jgi:hypothetical protein